MQEYDYTLYKLSPSKASRYFRCTKSLEFDLPFSESPASIRGTILHELSELKLNKLPYDDFIFENNINGYEMYLVDAYVTHVWNSFNQIGGRLLKVEVKETLEIFGFKINFICDAVIFGLDTIHIIDFKSGMNIVEVENNEQLLYYALWHVFNFPRYKKYILSIAQKGKLRSVEVTKDEVLDFFMSKEYIFDSIARNDLEYKPSDEACKFCDNRTKCRARAEWLVKGKVVV